MPKGKNNEDTTMLSMALLGYESERERIEQKIKEIRARLGSKASKSSMAVGRKAEAEPAGEESQSVATPRRILSPAARKRIAAAQKKRWAEHRKKAAEVQE